MKTLNIYSRAFFIKRTRCDISFNSDDRFYSRFFAGFVKLNRAVQIIDIGQSHGGVPLRLGGGNQLGDLGQSLEQRVVRVHVEGYKAGHVLSILVCMTRVIIGVDEAGRGPLAGPVAVGVVAVMSRFNLAKAFPGLDDSKKLSPKKREELYTEAVGRARAGELTFCVRFSGNAYIDRFGITRAVRRGVWSGVRALAPDPAGTKVFLDGLLMAPPEYKQETIIGGDALVPVISLASIMAKVERDWFMKKISKKYPEYGFEQHKGYGTKKHFAAIDKFGLCAIHRHTYCGALKSGV